MSIHVSPDSFDQARFPFTEGFSHPAAAQFTPKRQMIRSIVEDNGLGNFVYLKGISGRRYVFSAISREQAGLYSNALFATTNDEGTILDLQRSVGATAADAHLYVHVMDDIALCSIDTMADLAVAMD